ncbi:MAG: hypothetical protein FJX76_29015 [Armatimonadetes bacterium]|nr:hypothetical protein [Armatimonadota bacterium]
MLLEIWVWGSREWYEECQPILNEAGFRNVPEKQRNDPNTDGERMCFCYDYADEIALPPEKFSALVERLRAILKDAEAPLESIGIVRQ